MCLVSAGLRDGVEGNSRFGGGLGLAGGLRIVRNEAGDVEVGLDCSGCGGVSVVGSEVFNAKTRRLGVNAEFHARC
jgi:hypothetical protein